MANNLLPQSINLKEMKDFSRDIVPSLGTLMVRKSTTPGKKAELVHTPFALLPSPVPRRCFEEAVSLQTHFQELIFKVAHDHAFLKECLESVVKVDDFTGRLWQVYDEVYQQGLVNPLCLSLMRIDYMFHNDDSHHQPLTTTTTSNIPTTHSSTQPSNQPPTTTATAKSKTTTTTTTATQLQAPTTTATTTQPLPHSYHHLPPSTHLKQIELNTIAASFAGLSQTINNYYRLVVRNSLSPDLVDKIPPNRACDGLAEGLIAAWKAYGSEQAVVLFLVSEGEGNIFDQRHLECSIMTSHHNVRVIRRTHQYMSAHAWVDGERKLFVDHTEVAVVYLRTWYAPEDCVGEWQCRLMMERSRAIMCPSVGMQLAGTKKVQQVLASKGVLERFVEDGEVVEGMRRVFAGQYTLDVTEEGEEALELALKDPSRFVVKPQREGGGNNYYNDDIRILLEKIRHSDERAGFIMMDRINPLIIPNIPMVAGKEEEEEGCGGSSSCDKFVSMVSELGIYGYLLGEAGKVVVNRHSGHLLRTKRVGVNEGGVATGYSVLDTPFLVD